MVKEETKERLDSGNLISVIPLLFFFLSFLLIGTEMGIGGKRWEKEDPTK